MQGRKILTFTLDTRMGSYSLKISWAVVSKWPLLPAAGSYGYATGSGSYGGGYTKEGMATIESTVRTALFTHAAGSSF